VIYYDRLKIYHRDNAKTWSIPDIIPEEKTEAESPEFGEENLEDPTLEEQNSTIVTTCTICGYNMENLRNKNKDKKMEKAQRKGEKYSKTKNLHHSWQCSVVVSHLMLARNILKGYLTGL
jgi:hypothetical protein